VEILNQILNQPRLILKIIFLFLALVAIFVGVHDLIRYLRKEKISEYERKRSWFLKVAFGEVNPQAVLLASWIGCFLVAAVFVLVAFLL